MTHTIFVVGELMMDEQLDEQLSEQCDICDGGFSLVDGELVPAVDTILSDDKYYIDVCDECVEKYQIDYIYVCVDDIFEHEEHIVGDEYPPPSIN